MYTACILSQYHWDKAFHFPGKFQHVPCKNNTDSVSLGVVYLNLVVSTVNRVMFCEIYLRSVHITTIHDFFFLLLLFSSFFNRSSIPDPRFSIPDPPSSILAPGFPEKLDMGFLFYGHEVLKVECVIVKYKATRINTPMTHT